MASMERSNGPGNGEKLEFTVTLNPPGATLDGDPVYTSSDDTLVSVVPDVGNPLHGFLVNHDALATGIIVNVSGDADLGSGVQTIAMDFQPIDVTDHPAPPATGFGVTLTAVPA